MYLYFVCFVYVSIHIYIYILIYIAIVVYFRFDSVYIVSIPTLGVRRAEGLIENSKPPNRPNCKHHGKL